MYVITRTNYSLLKNLTMSIFGSIIQLPMLIQLISQIILIILNEYEDH